MKHKGIFWILLILLAVFIGLYVKTGFLQKDKIDSRDLKYWNYENGIIKGSEEIFLEGNNKTCWLLIHGYTSTPAELKEIALVINAEFNDSVLVPRMKGSGEVPSKTIDLTLEDWYLQSIQEFDSLKDKCEKVNIIGQSFGGTLASRLAEEKEIKNLYLMSPFFYARYKFYRIIPLENYLKIIRFTEYTKKSSVAQINSEEELKTHISYWNMPIAPILDSMDFIKITMLNAEKIKSPTLIQQSKNDDANDLKSSQEIYSKIDSSDKKLIIFEKSNHILIKDYDKEETIDNIINFEKERR